MEQWGAWVYTLELAMEREGQCQGWDGVPQLPPSPSGPTQHPLRHLQVTLFRTEQEGFLICRPCAPLCPHASLTLL